MDLNPIVLSIPIYFILILVELTYQVIRKDIRYRVSDAITNISCGIVDQVSGVFFKVFGIFIYTITFEYLRLFDIEKTWYTFAVLFVLADFCYYWAHRKSHQINLFWNGHVVHHQSEDYNLSVALRQGAFQTFFTSPFFLPLAILGFAPEFFLFTNAFVTLYQFWIHTENIGKLGWYEKIFNTPSHHRVHHGVNPKYIDRNHAGVFIIWDKMFGTFQEEEEIPTYGITVPLQSWNPVKAQFTPFVLMIKAMQQGRGVWDKLRIMLMPPGWFPEYAGGFKPPPKVNRSTYQKYQILNDKVLNVYGIFQFLVILVFVGLFLFFGTNLPHPMLTVYVITLVAYVGILGSLFELKKWSFYPEITRLISLPFLVYSFSSEEITPIAISIAITLISLMWLVSLKSKFVR